MRARPVVGGVMRERILSSVLLPAPLRPMMPSVAPDTTSNETSRSDHSVFASSPLSRRSPERRERLRGSRDGRPRERRGERLSKGVRGGRFTELVALSESGGTDDDVGPHGSDDVGERALRSPEVE